MQACQDVNVVQGQIDILSLSVARHPSVVEAFLGEKAARMCW